MSKRTIRLLVLLLFGCLFIISACGEKSQESVVKKVDKTLTGIDGYKIKAEMKMNTGQEEQVYHVDVWYKKDDNYRVALENDKDKEGQVILKNEDGVFVLTPALKKSFKFQTDWPENSSQPYLYQSLVNDVLEDKDAELKTDESNYIFSTKTNYQGNNHLPYQDVYFDKKTYLPSLVKVMDKERNVLIEVTFSENDMNPKLSKEDFSKDSILEEAVASLSESADVESDVLSVMYPLNTLGAELTEKKEVPLEDGERIIMTFKGDERNFTLIQQKEFSKPATSMEHINGDPISLGHSIGALSDNTIEWTRDGAEFYLASEDMTIEELLEVASSVDGRTEK